MTGKLTMLTPVSDPEALASAAADDAALLEWALAVVRQTPESRADRVALIRRRIREGSYHVPDHLLAQRIADFQG